ncbi:TolC family protein, partial [bacterium]|nr:TolC family protein [bacterium]
KAQVEVKQAELALISAERSAATARLGLLYTMGVSMTSDIEVVDPEDIGEDEVLEFDLDEAVNRRPDVRSQAEALVAAQRSLLVAKAGRWPSLGLSASYSKSGDSVGDVTGDFGDDYSTSVSLSLSVPIFNGLATKAGIDNSRSAFHTYELMLQDAKLSAAYEIETARLGVVEQRKRVAVGAVGLEKAEEELRVSEERFRLRAASMLDLIYARVAYSQARVDLVEAQYDYEITKASFKDALGL